MCSRIYQDSYLNTWYALMKLVDQDSHFSNYEMWLAEADYLSCFFRFTAHIPCAFRKSKTISNAFGATKCRFGLCL